MWCLVLFQYYLHDQYLLQGKEKLLLIDPLSQMRKLFTSASTLTESHETNSTVLCYNQANELHLPRRRKPVKALSEMTRQRLGAKCGRLRISQELST